MFRPSLITQAALLALWLPAAAFAQMTVESRFAPGQPPLVEATLGAEGHFQEAGLPEVSLAAIAHAIDVGADMVGLPVHVTKDGELVLMYGFTMNATTDVEEVFPNGSASRGLPAKGARKDAIADYTLAEIKQLQLTDGLGGGTHQVPTLDEALGLIDGRILATLVLKAYDREALLAVLEKHGTSNIIVDSGMNVRWIADIASAADVSVSMRVAYITDPVAYLDKVHGEYGPALVMISTRFLRGITPELIDRAAALGVRIGTWQGAADNFLTQGDATRWQDALESGATVFTTAHPTLLLEMLGR